MCQDDVASDSTALQDTHQAGMLVEAAAEQHRRLRRVPRHGLDLVRVVS